jgi:hypothetical protein
LGALFAILEQVLVNIFTYSMMFIPTMLLTLSYHSYFLGFLSVAIFVLPNSEEFVNNDSLTAFSGKLLLLLLNTHPAFLMSVIYGKS